MNANQRLILQAAQEQLQRSEDIRALSCRAFCNDNGAERLQRVRDNCAFNWRELEKLGD